MADAAAESVERMSEAEYRSIYTELSATAHGRIFMSEYARRNPHPDTRKLLATIARLQAISSDEPAVGAAELFRNLTDLAAAVTVCEAAVAENSRPLSDELFAAERIQDIALAMRRRGVEPALCDALDSAARGIVDGITARDAALKASNTTASLQDLAQRVDRLIAFVSSGAEPRIAEVSQARGAGWFDATSREPAPMTVQEVAPQTAQITVTKVVQSPETAAVPTRACDPTDSCATIFELSDAELIALFS